MKRFSIQLLSSFITLGLPLAMGTNAMAQERSQTPEKNSSGDSFSELLEKLRQENAEKDNEAKNENLPLNFDFPVPPVKPYRDPMPWGLDSSIYLESNLDGSVRHTLSEFVCPASLRKIPLQKPSVENTTGATVHCAYKNGAEGLSKLKNFFLVIDGVGGREVDLDALLTPVMAKASITPDLKSKKLSLGDAFAACRHDAGTDPNGVQVSAFACKYETYVIKFFSYGLSFKDSERALKEIAKEQDKFVETRELCVKHLKEINNMEPSSATSRPLLATSVEYQQNGPTCYFTSMLSPNVNGGFNQVLYTFPENPDTPLMMTLHRDDGRLIKTFRLQHAFAREADRDEKPAVYNLIKTDPDGTHIVYDTAYTRVLPIQRFFSESIKADTGKIDEKLELKRNAQGGFNMTMK